ncbi:glycosyltransferase 87 family protein [Gordonia sp. DT30]|uniref:glycosyltransferase 87 family protein n=1 Tax=unclassified Gordonia (in: high G+C Gram-positive bacteria) TaxID=2657482 RepID=UPI003CFA1C95
MTTMLTAVDEWLRRWSPTRRVRVVIGVIFAASAGMQMFGVPFTSSFATRTRIDLDVYRIGAQIWQQGQSLYADGSMPFTSDGIWLPFTYPPFAALGFVPLGAMPLPVAGVVMSVFTIGLLVLSLHIVLSLISVGTHGNRWWLATLIAAGALWLNPVWMTLGFGQVNVILMAMILVDVFVVARMRRPWGRAQGILAGLASAIKLTPLVFIGVFAAAGRWRAAATAGLAFVLAGAFAWVWLPGDSLGYWTHTLFHTTRIGDPAGRINQNLNAAWVRLLPGLDGQIAWVISSLAITALMVCAVRACRPRESFRAGANASARVNAVLATCAIAVWGLLVSPTSWAHHWVWAIPLIVTALAVSARTSSRATRVAYLVLAVVGVILFSLGPFQFLPQNSSSWSAPAQIVGSSYSIWGIAALVVLWRLPFHSADEADDDDAAKRRALADTPIS